MRFDDNKIETALIVLERSDWFTFHALMNEMSDVERAHVENQMDIEDDLNYQEWIKNHSEPLPADIDDEIA